jgi:hypothetical protein
MTRMCELIYCWCRNDCDWTLNDWCSIVDVDDCDASLRWIVNVSHHHTVSIPILTHPQHTHTHTHELWSSTNITRIWYTYIHTMHSHVDRGWIAHMVRVMREWVNERYIYTYYSLHVIRSKNFRLRRAIQYSPLHCTVHKHITGEYGMGARSIDTPKKWQSQCKKNRSIPGSYRKKWIISLSLKKPVTNKCAALLVGTSDLCPTVKAARWPIRVYRFSMNIMVKIR